MRWHGKGLVVFGIVVVDVVSVFRYFFKWRFLCGTNQLAYMNGIYACNIHQVHSRAAMYVILYIDKHSFFEKLYFVLMYSAYTSIYS